MGQTTDEINQFDRGQRGTIGERVADSQRAKDEPQSESDRIRAEIDRTRARLDRTVDQLKRRVSVNQLTRHGIELVREGTGTAARTIGRWASENPLPTAMMAAGAVWLLMSQRSARGEKPKSIESDDQIYGEYVTVI